MMLSLMSWGWNMLTNIFPPKELYVRKANPPLADTHTQPIIHTHKIPACPCLLCSNPHCIFVLPRLGGMSPGEGAALSLWLTLSVLGQWNREAALKILV